MPYSNQKNNVYLDCFGDSLTFNINYGIRPDNAWPARLKPRFQLMGALITPRNWGKSGDTTWQIMSRISDPGYLPTASAGLLMGGANDPASSITQTQTQFNIQAICRAINWGCASRAPRYPVQSVSNPSALPAASTLGFRYYVTNDNDATGGLSASISGNILGVSLNPLTTIWECKGSGAGPAGWGRIGVGQCVFGSQTNLPRGNIAGSRCVVLTDTSTTGGATPNSVSTTPTVPGSVLLTPAIGVWECRNSAGGETGWGRIAVAGTSGSPMSNRVGICTLPYLNFTTGGDQLATPYAPYLAVRNAQTVAATNEGALLVDIYTYQRNLIVAGTFPNFFAASYVQDQSWHVADQNQHPSELASDLWAEKIYGDIVNASWLAAVTPVAAGV